MTNMLCFHLPLFLELERNDLFFKATFSSQTFYEFSNT